MAEVRVRTMVADDRGAVGAIIYESVCAWYRRVGIDRTYEGGAGAAAVFFDVYEALDAGCGLVAEEARSGRPLGCCFFHPRPHHVSLGTMNVHPDAWGRGVGRALLRRVVDLAEAQRKPLRLVSSALNMDSYSLYNRAGFVPRQVYQTVRFDAPPAPPAGPRIERDEAAAGRLRDAAPADVEAIAALEQRLAGISRAKDCRHCIENREGFWRISVCEDERSAIRGRPPAGIRGWLIACSHPAMSMIGPGVAEGEAQAAALIGRELARHPARPLRLMAPVECADLIGRLYEWGARNSELHLGQVRGAFRPYRGVNLPSLLPETG